MKRFFKNEKIIKLYIRAFRMSISVLAGLLDDKLIRVISLFMKNPEKKFYLSEVARKADVNTATTFRILNKILKENIVRADIIGKVRTYQLARGERVRALSEVLKKEDSDVLNTFCQKITAFPRIKLVLLESKTSTGAKVIIVGDFPSRDSIGRVVKELLDTHKFKINFAEINVQQYKDMKLLGMMNDKRVLYRKPGIN